MTYQRWLLLIDISIHISNKHTQPHLWWVFSLYQVFDSLCALSHSISNKQGALKPQLILKKLQLSCHRYHSACIYYRYLLASSACTRKFRLRSRINILLLFSLTLLYNLVQQLCISYPQNKQYSWSVDFYWICFYHWFYRCTRESCRLTFFSLTNWGL
jgi:hypothetical protein